MQGGTSNSKGFYRMDAHPEASLVALHPPPEQSFQVGGQLLLPNDLHLVLLPRCRCLPTPASHSPVMFITSLVMELFCALAEFFCLIKGH